MSERIKQEGAFRERSEWNDEKVRERSGWNDEKVRECGAERSEVPA